SGFQREGRSDEVFTPGFMHRKTVVGKVELGNISPNPYILQTEADFHFIVFVIQVDPAALRYKRGSGHVFGSRRFEAMPVFNAWTEFAAKHKLRVADFGKRH